MLVSCKWLAEVVDTGLEPEKIASILTGLGLETSIAVDRRGWYEGIAAGRVLSVAAHPGADILSLCKVDAGGATLDIVCGAPNVAEGQLVPVAMEGAKLPNGMTIVKRKVRGQASEGMICSEEELELSGEGDGIMVLEDDGSIKPGDRFADKYEVCDTILEVDLTPNRGDCLSVIGVARELAAATGAKLILPDSSIDEDPDEASSGRISVELLAPKLCPRYAGRVLTGVKVARSPFWMRRRLASMGVRAINNLVDVTNYVLLETGHPLHAFDLSELSGAKIVIRQARPGEEFTTLDGKAHKLAPEHLVIADQQRAVALAGVMGGANSEVKDSTTDVMLEAAFFDPSSIRRTSKALSLKTESSFRFERGCDVEGMIYAQDRAAKLMTALGGGKALSGRVDAYPAPLEKRRVRIRQARAEALLGVEVSLGRVEEILNNLEMNTVSKDSGAVTVEAPHFRFDIEREADLIEEVARFVGYGAVPSSVPEVPVSLSGISAGLQMRMALRRHLRSIGLMEGMRYSFVSRDDMDKFRLPEDHPWRSLVAIDNPLSADWTHMRPSLLPGLVSGLKGALETSIFEIGAVFFETGPGASEERWMAGVILSENVKPGIWEGKAPKRDFFHIKGVAESALQFLGLDRAEMFPSQLPFYYPKRQLEIQFDGKTFGAFGQVRPETAEAYGAEQEIFAMELDLTLIADMIPPEPMVRKIPRFPSVKRDLAVVVDEDVSAWSMERSIRSHGGALVREATLFDIFTGEKIGEGKKSAAFSLEFMDETKTLVDEEANQAFERILKGLEKDCGARLR